MNNFLIQLKNFFLNLFFPSFCLGCQREGNWLCEDCLATLEIQENIFCPICLKRALDFRTCLKCRKKTSLSGLLWAVPYQNPLVKKFLHQFKYEPFLKELSRPLAYLIISHLLLTSFREDWLRQFALIPLPLHKKRKKWRGFDQAEEIAKEISNYLKIPVFNDILIRGKETLPQVDLEGKKREENVKNAFICPTPEKIKGRKIFLVDDVYTSGATMEEAARVLKTAGAKEIWGIVVARG